jgi:starch-binding outer membrane protein, SusD/RagB family
MRAITLSLAVVLVCACSDLLTVDAPDVVEPGRLENADGAVARYVGALTLFYGAYGANSRFDAQSVVFATGLVADEFTNTSVAAANVALNSRVMSEDGGLGGGSTFGALSQARTNALAGVYALEQYAPQPLSRIGQLFAVVGYTELFFAENYCSGLPLAEFTGGRPTGVASYGTPLTRVEMLDRALEDFDSAAANAGTGTAIQSLAAVGRGRVLLDLGQFAAAATAVSAVPTAFVYSSEHSATINPNSLAQAVGLSVADAEGTNGLNFRSANDPRVTVVQGTGSQASQFLWTKMLSLAAPITLASGIEARLIEAEAALQAGDTATWLNIHNGLRATVVGLAPLADPGSVTAREDLHFRERAFWLFGQGQRLSDLRRLVRQYGRAVGAVFPVGAYVGPGASVYGNDVTMTPLRSSEAFNPTYSGCQNRDP